MQYNWEAVDGGWVEAPRPVRWRVGQLLDGGGRRRGAETADPPGVEEEERHQDDDGEEDEDEEESAAADLEFAVVEFSVVPTERLRGFLLLVRRTH